MRPASAALSLAVALAAAMGMGSAAANLGTGGPAGAPSSTPLNRSSEAMTKPLAEQIVGRWRKVPGPACAAPYPDEVTFLDGGVYLSQAGEAQGFVQWGGGDYELLASDRVKLQIQTDAMVAYGISIEGDQMRIKDSDGCEFTYRRIG